LCIYTFITPFDNNRKANYFINISPKLILKTVRYVYEVVFTKLPEEYAKLEKLEIQNTLLRKRARDEEEPQLDIIIVLHNSKDTTPIPIRESIVRKIF